MNARGQETDLLVEQGQVVGDPNRLVRVVTLNFLAAAQATSPGLGGDGYPFPAYAENLVDLAKVLTDPGLAFFAAPGSEQDALAEYLRAHHATAPYAIADTAVTSDNRLVNLVALSPQIVGLALTAGGVEITVATVAGRLYGIEFTEALGTAWETLPNGVVRGDDQVAKVVDASAGSPNRFYRVSLLE